MDKTMADEIKIKFDTRRMKQLQMYANAKNMTLKIVDLQEFLFREPRKAMEELVREIKQFLPTRIIFTFSSEKYYLFKLIIQMQNWFLLEDKETDRGSNFVVYDTKNIFQNDKCFLSSITATYYTGIEYSIFDGIDNIVKARQTKLLIISGSRGAKDGKESGFNNEKLLLQKHYDDARRFFNLSTDKSHEAGLPQSYSPFNPAFESASEFRPMGQPSNLQIMVLNIKHFTNNDKGLIEFIRQHMPHGIILDWSFSKGCDLADTLIISGILPELRLTMERTSLVGANDNWIQLDENQKTF